ncbi:hypothetical protein BJ170DRAFT_735933 [Xylariales sp. AK1849]|nr:hypothetical protein BJ170DRAFT_735933 [Xylariales sp. AK1849]
MTGISKLGAAVPIAQLQLDLHPSTRSVHGIVTIVWPYSSLTKSIAFNLAEPEIRLRRLKGQVRVNFVGSSAKAVSDCGLGSSDEVQLSLDGARFVPNVAKGRMPGTELDWQLEFSERLLMKVKPSEGEAKTLDIDYPSYPEPEPEPEAPVAPLTEPELEPFNLDLPPLPVSSGLTPAKNESLPKLTDGEYVSPAFVKRARISYGSLFEGDIFEEDGGVKGKGRKKSRFGRNSGAWRYSSQPSSPEPAPTQKDDISSDEDKRHASPLRPQMNDEGCQTMELDFSDLEPLVKAPVLVEPQAIPPLVQETNPFMQQNNGFIDQGHQTLPLGGWGTAITTSQPSFADSGFFTSNQERPTPFDSGLELGVTGGQIEEGWAPQPVENHSVTYPELPVEKFAPTVEHSSEATLAAGFGDLGAASGHRYPSQPDVFRASSDGRESVEGGLELVEDDYPHSMQPGANYPELEVEDIEPVLSPAHPAVQVPLGSSFTAPGVSLVQDTVTAPANPFARKDDISLDRAAVNARTSSWAPINSTNSVSRASSRPLTDRMGSTDGQIPDAALVIDESDPVDQNDEDQSNTSGIAPQQSHPLTSRGVLYNGPGSSGTRGEQYADVAEAEFEEEARQYSGVSGDEDEDEEGGDYDTRNYLRTEDDDDDSHDDDLRSHRLEPEFDNGEGGSYYEGESEEQFDEEEDYESDYEMDDDVLQSQPQPQPPRRQPAQQNASGPVVIDLLSSSEDEDEDQENQAPPPRLAARSMPVSRPASMSARPPASSPDYGPESDEEEEIYEDESESEDEGELELTRVEDVSAAPSVQEEEEDQEKDEKEIEREEEKEENEEDEDSGSEAQGSSNDDDIIKAATENATLEHHTEIEEVEKAAVPQQDDTLALKENEEEDEDMRDPDSDASEESVTEHRPELRQGENDYMTHNVDDDKLSEVDVVEASAFDQENDQDGTDEAAMGHSDAANEHKFPQPDNKVELISASDEMVPPTTKGQERGLEQTLEADIVAPSSPPLTQSFQSQVLEDQDEIARQETTVTVESQGLTEQLPTPLDTQQVVSTSQETKTITTMEIDEVETLHGASDPSEIHTTIREEVTEVSQVAERPIVVPDFEGHVEIGNDANSFMSQSDGDDALQAALREGYEDEDGDEDEDLEDAIVLDDEPMELMEPKRYEAAAQELDQEETHGPAQKAVQEEIAHTEELRVTASSHASSPVLGSTPIKPQAEPVITVSSPELPPSSKQKPKSTKEAADDPTNLDPSVKLARAAVASRRGNRYEATPEVTRPHTRSRSLQKSPTPEVGDDSVQLAKASLHTPSKAHKVDAKAPVSSPASSKLEEEAGSLTATKLKLVRHLRDELAEYTNLKVLRQHMGKSVDVMAIAMMSPADPQRAKGGPREYMMSFTVTDHSIGPNGLVEVQLYRPHKDSLPRVKAGDVVLLRNFGILSLKGKGFGLRTNDGSSWAVFDKVDEPAQINGPPVEYGDGETVFVGYLREWFGFLDEKAKEKLTLANDNIIDAPVKYR